MIYHARNDQDFQTALSLANDGDTIEVHPGCVVSRISSYDHPFGCIRIRGWRNTRWPLHPNNIDRGIILAHSRCAGIKIEDFDLDAYNLNSGDSDPGDAIKITNTTGGGAADRVTLSNFSVRNAPRQGILATSVTGLHISNGLVSDCGRTTLDHGIYLGGGSTLAYLTDVSTLRPSGYGICDYHGEAATQDKTGHVIARGWHIASKLRSGILIGGTETTVTEVISYGHAQFGVEVYYTARRWRLQGDLHGRLGGQYISPEAVL